MEKFQKLRSQVVPLPLNDVDTDQIIPARYLTSTSRSGYAEGLFRTLRDTDPSFVLNQERFRGAEILAVGSNFGCGSSREHAVWALLGAGFRVILGSGFADIFFGNSTKNGLLVVTLPDEIMHQILQGASKESYSVEVNLEKQSVVLPDGNSISFQFDPFRRHCLLNGLDDLDYILAHRDQIDRHFARENGER